MKEKMNLFVSKATTYCKSYIELSIWLIPFSIVMRIFEAVLFSKINHDFGLSLLWNTTGLCYDIFLFLRIGIWILIPFVAACFLNEKIARIFVRIILSFMLFVSLILIVFFTNSGFLLDKVLFTYSIQEIWGIVRSSNTNPVWVYIVMGILPICYFYLSGKRIKINNLLLALFAGVTLLSFFILKDMQQHINQYNVKTNKAYFLGKSIVEKQTFAFTECNEEILKAVHGFRHYFPELQFKETEFPFLHKATYKDVLSPFFNLKNTPPNLVFIIVEGLGNDVVCSDIQIMPFLDSLSKESLSWEYCLSVAPRTFGVLPSLFGSAPLGEAGFMSLSPASPEHHALPKILKKNGYTNHFFYGGWIGFDNMASYLEINNINYFKNNDWDQDIKNETIGVEWGFEDHLTYMQAHRKLERVKSSPRLDLYLSLTTHQPWDYPKSSYFQDILKEKVTQNNDLSEQQKKKLLNSSTIYGCFAYADWAIQQLFEGYKKRNDFDNTIFIITGDHSFSASQFEGYSNYHVPLIIYSPMLKSSRKMKGVVSHRDIPPTLISLLKNNFNIETPSEVAWLNTALDTSLTFRANTFSPLQTINHSIGGILYKNYMLCEGILEELTDGAPRRVSIPDIFQQMNRLLSLYQFLDQYVLNNDALIKSKYAHKHKSKDYIINIEDDISAESYFAKNSKLQVVNGPKGRKTTLYFDNSNEYPVNFLHLNIPDGMEDIEIEIEFMVYLVNKTVESKRFNVVTDLANVSYKSDQLTNAQHNQWYTYKNNITYKKDMLELLGNERYLKIYLWNPDGLEGYVDDIKVRVW